MPRFERYQASLEYVEGFILSRKEILGGSKLLFSLFTEKRGKISAILHRNANTHYEGSILDLIEFGIYRPQGPMKADSLFSIGSFESNVSAEHHFCPLELTATDPITISWKRMLPQIGRLLNRLLLQEEPRPDVWNFLSSLYQASNPFTWPETFFLFAISLFLADEGLSISEIMKAADRLPKSVQKRVIDEIQLFIQGDGTLVQEHKFSQEIVDLFSDLFGFKLHKD